jgi:ATP-dependent helicase/nuclease subunit B
LKVGNGEPLESIKVKTDNGISVSLKGSIDRVDTTADGKVRVVDYKTGVKEFKLSSVLSGMNMQMLLYLYTAVKNGTELLKADIPAGILYFPARRNITDDLPEKYIKMNGLIDGDIDTVKQMEENCEGKIVPAKLRSSGNSFYSSESMVNQDGFKIIFKYLDVALKQIGEAIMNGDITALPLKVGQNLKCDYCDYRAICKLSNNGEFKEVIKLKTTETLEKMENVAKGEE